VASMAEANAGMATRETLEQQADAAKPRPKANVEATELKDVYTVDNLIGSEVFKSIPVLEWQKSVKEKRNISTNSKYVSSRIVNAATVGVEKLKILRYLLVLLDLHMSCKPINGGKQLPKAEDLRTKLGNIPEPVVADIRRKFSDAGVMSRFRSDLLITHICALACLIDNYEVDLYDLQLDLKLGTKEMSQYFKEIGARVTDLTVQRIKDLGLDKAAASQRRMAKLKLPLEFPRVPMAGKRR
jgi:DNA-directed RNA polymerase I subunit RPA49